MTERTPVFAGAEDPGGARMQGALSGHTGSPSWETLTTVMGESPVQAHDVPEGSLLYKQNTAFERGGKPQTSLKLL